MFDAVVALGWLLAIGSALSVAPQAWKTWRTRNLEGVSHLTVASALSTMVMWCFYTFSRVDWPAFAGSVGPLIAFSIVLYVMLRLKSEYAQRTALAVVFAVFVAVVVTAIGHISALGWVAGTGAALWGLPQLKTALTQDLLDGVSVSAFVIVALEAAGWVVYGLLMNAPAYGLGPLVQFPTAVLIAYKAYKAQKAH